MGKAKRKVFVFQDLMVLIMLVILFCAFSAASVVIWHIATRPNIIGSNASILAAKVLAVATALLLPTLLVIDPDRYIVWFWFTSEGIEYHTLFRKKQLKPYSAYPYIKHGKYLHGVYWREYIVFTNRFLTDDELKHINHVAPSKQLIKIRYSETTKAKLLTILPDKQKKLLLQ